MTDIRWLSGTVFLAIFLVTTISNVIYVYGWRTREERASLIYLVGGVAGLLGFLILPVPLLNRWFWLPVLSDFTIVCVIALLLMYVKRLLG